MIHARLSAVEYHLPEKILTNDELVRQFPDWTAQKITEKTGIVERRIAAPEETALDLAVAAAEKLFANDRIDRESIDFVLFCTQAPDHFLPAGACIIQNRLGVPTFAGALDINQGCSGFVYSLALAKGLVESGSASRILVLTGDTYSKYLAPDDKSVRTLFGDGAAATIVEATDEKLNRGESWIGPFDFGTDGSGAEKLIVPGGAARARFEGPVSYLVMDGPSIFSFTLKVVPKTVRALLEKANLSYDDIDRFVFHQANFFMIETLRKSLKIPEEKFVVDLAHSGNTVSSTIPIALHGVLAARQDMQKTERMMLVGFGVGLSWGSVIIVV